MGNKLFAATMLYTAKRLPGCSGNGTNLWTRDEFGMEVKEIHRSYPYDSGRFFLATTLYGRKRGNKVIFTNGAF